MSVVFTGSNFGIFHKIRKWSVSITISFLVFDFALSGYILSFLYASTLYLSISLSYNNKLTNTWLLLLLLFTAVVWFHFIIPEHFSISFHSFSSSISISFESSSFRPFPKRILWAHLFLHNSTRNSFHSNPLQHDVLQRYDWSSFQEAKAKHGTHRFWQCVGSENILFIISICDKQKHYYQTQSIPIGSSCLKALLTLSRTSYSSHCSYIFHMHNFDASSLLLLSLFVLRNPSKNIQFALYSYCPAIISIIITLLAKNSNY